MNNPITYEKANLVLKKEAEYFLQKYSSRIQWKKSPSVLDLGSGDGSVTATVLTKFVPNDYKEIKGIDISPNMVEFANERYKDNRIGFCLMDIAGDVPKEFKARFDIAFSSYALNWVMDQRKAFRNIYDMLAEDGKCVLMIGGRSDMFDVYKELANTKKWKKYVNNHNYLSVYHTMEDPIGEVEKVMKEIGFKNIEVIGKPTFHTYEDIEVLKNLLRAANLLKVPQEVLEEFVEDAIKLSIGRNALVKTIENAYKFEITSIQIYAKK